MIGRPFVLLRFHAPEYEHLRRPRDRALAHPGRPARVQAQRGLPGDRRQADGVRPPGLRARARRGRGRELLSRDRAPGSRAGSTCNTQSRIHVLVTHGFLRSLARLELEESAVGRFSGEAPQAARSTSATRPGRAWPRSPLIAGALASSLRLRRARRAKTGWRRWS